MEKNVREPDIVAFHSSSFEWLSCYLAVAMQWFSSGSLPSLVRILWPDGFQTPGEGSRACGPMPQGLTLDPPELPSWIHLLGNVVLGRF